MVLFWVASPLLDSSRQLALNPVNQVTYTPDTVTQLTPNIHSNEQSKSTYSRIIPVVGVNIIHILIRIYHTIKIQNRLESSLQHSSSNESINSLYSLSGWLSVCANGADWIIRWDYRMNVHDTSLLPLSSAISSTRIVKISQNFAFCQIMSNHLFYVLSSAVYSNYFDVRRVSYQGA